MVKEKGVIPTKLNPNYYKWAIAAQARVVTDAYNYIMKTQDKNDPHPYWDEEGTLCMNQTSEDWKEKQAENLYLQDAKGNPVLYKKYEGESE